jgi:uncharacterized membrane protein (DUF106 family)
MKFKMKIFNFTTIAALMICLCSCNGINSDAHKMAKLVCDHQKLYEKLHAESESGNVKALSELQESKKAIDDFKDKLTNKNYSQEEKDKFNEVYKKDMADCGVASSPEVNSSNN